MNKLTLLPPGSTRLEKSAAAVGEHIDRLPVPLRTLHNPNTCPVHLLPYLAWQYSVDYWDTSWPESTKRAVVAAAFFVHQHKGTIAALRRAIEPLGYTIAVTEWFNQLPPARPGTFTMQINVQQTGITDTMHDEVLRLIDDAKPVSRHLTALIIALETATVPLFVGAATFQGDTLTVYAYTPSEAATTGQCYHGGYIHLIDTMSNHP